MPLKLGAVKYNKHIFNRRRCELQEIHDMSSAQTWIVAVVLRILSCNNRGLYRLDNSHMLATAQTILHDFPHYTVLTGTLVAYLQLVGLYLVIVLLLTLPVVFVVYNNSVPFSGPYVENTRPHPQVHTILKTPTVRWPIRQPSQVAFPVNDTSNRTFLLKCKRLLYRANPDFPVFAPVRDTWLQWIFENPLRTQSVIIPPMICVLLIWVYSMLRKVNLCALIDPPTFTVVPVEHRDAYVEQQLTCLSLLPCIFIDPVQIQIDLPYSESPSDWVRIQQGHIVSMRVCGHLYQSPSHDDLLRLAPAVFLQSDVMVHAIRGHFLSDCVALATHRFIHPRHPLYPLFYSSMYGSYELSQVTSGLATHPGISVTNVVINHEGHNIGDFMTAWTTLRFAERAVFHVNWPEPPPIVQYARLLATIVEQVCTQLVEILYATVSTDEDLTQHDSELRAWHRCLLDHLPGMHPVLTKATLAHTLACYLVCPIYHDVFHHVLTIIELVNPGNPDGNQVTDRLGNCLDMLAMKHVRRIISTNIGRGLPYGYFLQHCYVEMAYQRPLDLAWNCMRKIHASYKQVGQINNTILA